MPARPPPSRGIKASTTAGALHNAAGHNTHPETKRSYLLRSFVFCSLCGRRMFGKTRDTRSYYACAPRKGYDVPQGHPRSFWIGEDSLVDGLNEFLTAHVFGAYRTTLLADTLDTLVHQDE